MKNRSGIFAAVLTALMMFFSLSAASYAGAENTVHISIGGQAADIGAIERGGTLFLPLRSVCETLGYSVEWSGESRSVTVKNHDKTVLFEPKADLVTDAGHSYYVNEGYIADAYIGGGCMLVNSRIYVASDIMDSCFGIKETYNQEENTLILSIETQRNPAAENRRIIAEDDKLLTNIQYPYFSLAEKTAADKINEVVIADVKAARQEAQDNLQEYGSYQSPNKCETYFNYKITCQKGDILSLVLFDYQYYGGAHGITRQISHTFDIKTGREYDLADLMEGGSGYEGYINDFIRQDIVKEGLEDAQLVKFESIADDQNYYLSNKGLVIYFQQYEYFPYAAGIPEYNLPYDGLERYFNPEFEFLCMN